MGVVLAAGGAVRIFRASGELVSQVDSGQLDALDVRHLSPGAYVAKQEQVSEAGVDVVSIEFVVDAGDEYARLPVDGEGKVVGADSVSSGPVQAPRPAAKRVRKAAKPAAKKAAAKK